MSSSGLAALAPALGRACAAAFVPAAAGAACPEETLFALAKRGSGTVDTIGASDRAGGATSSTAAAGGELAVGRGLGSMTAEAMGGVLVAGLAWVKCSTSADAMMPTPAIAPAAIAKRARRGDTARATRPEPHAERVPDRAVDPSSP